MRNTQLKGGFAFVTGDAGVGKTKALSKLVKNQRHDSVIITINPCTKSAKAVLKLLALTLGACRGFGSRDDLSMSIAAKLHDGMVIAVDEAQLLTYGSIETLRWFADLFAERRQTLGVVLVGNGGEGENEGRVTGAVPPGREQRMAAAANKHRGTLSPRTSKCCSRCLKARSRS
ncbi:MAG: ATP-binding protein [Oscillospiraceae bacterium]